MKCGMPPKGGWGKPHPRHPQRRPQGFRRAAAGYRGGMARRRGRGRFSFWGPFPSYSRRTRGGGRVRVTGCCLPLALAMAAPPTLAARELWRRR